MKKLKHFTALTVFIFFSYANANAQNEKEVITVTYPGGYGNILCLGESIIGETTYTQVIWDNKILMKITGTYIGQTSGDRYHVNELVNLFLVSEKTLQGWMDRIIFAKEGGPAIVAHFRFLMTINDNGEMKVLVDEENITCD
jgi:hypothetical protein